ncbi:uncharacterized protein LOC127257673 isoform X2 [Andrographis paniculata]|uniref:uncharacterized protein LOC127257673 isoform X2 n=1 Tax=Andrographis paniculata TaxID=175694 RepID=UPI0021E855A9|nr:uncharacterized protein LOC127257673 isoform X2 [Andrographis paniculata]
MFSLVIILPQPLYSWFHLPTTSALRPSKLCSLVKSMFWGNSEFRDFLSIMHRARIAPEDFKKHSRPTSSINTIHDLIQQSNGPSNISSLDGAKGATTNSDNEVQELFWCQKS